MKFLAAHVLFVTSVFSGLWASASHAQTVPAPPLTVPAPVPKLSVPAPTPPKPGKSGPPIVVKIGKPKLPGYGEPLYGDNFGPNGSAYLKLLQQQHALRLKLVAPSSGQYNSVVTTFGPAADGSVSYQISISRRGGDPEALVEFSRAYHMVGGSTSLSSAYEMRLPDQNTSETLSQYVLRLNPFNINADFAWQPRLAFGPAAAAKTLDYIIKIPKGWHYVSGSAVSGWPYLDAKSNTYVTPPFAVAPALTLVPTDATNPSYLTFSQATFGPFDPSTLTQFGDGTSVSAGFAIAPNT